MFLLTSLFSAGIAAQAQTSERKIISGIVLDDATGETLIGAQIFTDGGQPAGTMSNEYGYFNLTAPKDARQAFVKYIGYVTDTLDLGEDKLLNREIRLQSAAIITDVAVVEAQGSAKQTQCES